MNSLTEAPAASAPRAIQKGHDEPFRQLNEPASLSNEVLLTLYRMMVRARRLEEKTAELAEAQEIRCPVHLYLGQEAVAAGICANLDRTDYLFGTHRSHGHYLCKGGELKPMIAEFFGKATGCAGGRGGSMHLIDLQHGMPGTTPIVAASIPMAVGAALASKMRGDGRVTAAFFGDGATEEGTFHESMNLAAVCKLPIVFVCENNFFSSHLPLLKRHVQDNLNVYSHGHSVPETRIDGNDVIAVYRAGKAAVEHARAGHGPTFLECRTYRWRGHVGPAWEWNLNIRSREEVEEWMTRCPIRALANQLEARGIGATRLAEITRQSDEEIEEAVRFARASEHPPTDSLLDFVYVDGEQ